MGLLSYLTAPAALPPRYGLSHEFDIESEEFLNTVAGASSTPFVSGNIVEPLNNGDAFYPRMLDAVANARVSITIEAYIYWAGEIGHAVRRSLAERARSGVTVKILLDAIGSASIGADILRILEDGGCQVAWYNPIHWYTIGRFNNRTHRKSLIVDGRLGIHRRRRHRGSLARRRPRAGGMARHAGSDRRPCRRSPAGGVRAQLAADDRRAL